MTDAIIQWNCRGIKANIEELHQLSAKLNPAIICLQETFLKDKQKINLYKYQQFNYIKNTDLRASGGTSILVRNDIPHSHLELKTNFQAIAIKVTLHKQINICSIYIPPNQKLKENELQNIIWQLPTPFILLGDFNSHNPIWGSNETNQKGEIMEKLINNNNLCIFNNQTPTYICPTSGKNSAIDLTLCDPSTLMDFSWSTYNDTCGSDHFPIILENLKVPLEEETKKWKLKKANWEEYKKLCSIHLNTNENIQNIEDFTYKLTMIAEKCIPFKSTSYKRNKPWYTKECQEAIKLRRKALRKFQTEPTKQNLINFKFHKAIARKTIKEAKRTSWQKYVSELNLSTNQKSVWNMLRSMSGKKTMNPIKHLSVDNTLITEKKQIADSLAKQFAKNSNQINPKFQKIKYNAEKHKLNLSSDNHETYNELISLEELINSIKKSHNTAVGPDKIHNEFLKQLPEESIKCLLNVLNNTWENNLFPEIWKEMIIIPIPKTGKDSSNPQNYRPIALTSCLCKTLERIANQRLIWHLEINNLITNIQTGFRKKRGTIDQITRLETLIREAFIKKQHMTAIFFDIEKAYDTTWRYGIIKDIQDLGIRGRLALFIKNFLGTRNFKVRIGTTLSNNQNLTEGIPQGSVLSTTLFAIKINKIIQNLTPAIDSALYVDDFVISYRSHHIHSLERTLQLNLNRINNWAINNGFSFSKSKTQCVHFCPIRKLHNDPVLKLEGDIIPVVNQYKFLGVIFDKKLNFIPHINYLRRKCNNTLQLLRVVAHTKWGADQQTLHKIYKYLIRSQLDYACFIYRAARKSYLKKLDPIHHGSIRLILGAFRTSPVESLFVEANEYPPQIRSEKLALQYYLKIKSTPSNPAYENIFNPKYKYLFESNEKTIKPFGLRMDSILKETEIITTNIHNHLIPNIPPWKIKTPNVNLSLKELQKAKTHPSIYQEEIYNILKKYPKHHRIYTDGSKDKERTACAAVSNIKTLKKALPSESSIFSAEAYAINLALEIIHNSSYQKFIILSDSRSVLESLKNKRLENPLIVRLLCNLNTMANNKEILLCWTPGHIGEKGNEKADRAAKSALKLTPDNIKIPFTDLKPKINKFLQNKWQQEWNQNTYNKLFQIKTKVNEYTPTLTKSRKEQVVLSRLRIGHTNLTHSFILKKELQPKCNTCQTPLTVIHILIECKALTNLRTNLLFNANNMKNLFKYNDAENIFKFLKELKIYQKI